MLFLFLSYDIHVPSLVTLQPQFCKNSFGSANAYDTGDTDNSTNIEYCRHRLALFIANLLVLCFYDFLDEIQSAFMLATQLSGIKDVLEYLIEFTQKSSAQQLENSILENAFSKAVWYDHFNITLSKVCLFFKNLLLQ